MEISRHSKKTTWQQGNWIIISQADMDHLGGDGCFGDNVESFLSLDESDVSEKVGKGMINLIDELSALSFPPSKNISIQ